jgi:UDP-N-acetylmuramoylalanine--D-glutamate ligase
MIRASTFAGKTVAVFGLGGSGLATARVLMAGGATVVGWDDGAAGRTAAGDAGVPLEDLKRADWSRFAALVLAPGVPLTHPAPHWTVELAKAAGVEVIGDVEIFFRERAAQLPDAVVVAITGTNGKSTTTALTAHILREAGRDVQMGGNIGVPVLALEPFAQGRVYVLELSSFQIDLTPSLKPTVGVLLNITPDHLDRHGPADDTGLAMRNYAAIKERVVAQANQAILGCDDAWCATVADGLIAAGQRVVQFASAPGTPADVFYCDGALYHPQSPLPIAMLSGVPTLRGRHNGQNAAAAALVGLCLGLDREVIARHMRTYPGLPHRMEEVGTLVKPGGRILFINDSKATNADSTEKALASFPRDIHWILGGKPKEGGIAMLEPYFDRIAKAYLIGAASDDFAKTLDGKVAFERCGTLDVALAAATQDALASGTAEPVVLLSPACASYDQFRSFEHRGDSFRDLVRALPGVDGEGRV